MVFYLTHICVCVLEGGTECKRRCFTVWERLAVCDLLNRDQSYFHITVFNSTTPRQKPSSARLASIITGSPVVTGRVKICQLLTCVYGVCMVGHLSVRILQRILQHGRGKGQPEGCCMQKTICGCVSMCVYILGGKNKSRKKNNFKDCLEPSDLRSDFGEA